MSRRPVHLAAVVPPWAAFVISRDFGREIERKAAAIAAAQPEVARQLRVALEQMREAGRQQYDAAVGNRCQAEVGNAEVPSGAGVSASAVSPRFGLTTRQVAERLELKSDRQVRNLIKDQVLSATRRGRGPYVVDEVSVAIEEERRRRARDERTG